MSLVKIFASCVLIGFLVTCDLAPGNADILSFQTMLANFTRQKHLATSANMTSDGQRAGATWATDTESRHSLNWIWAMSHEISEYLFTRMV